MTNIALVITDGVSVNHTEGLPVIERQALANADPNFDAFLIDPARDPHPFDTLQAVRQTARPDVYLRPVFATDRADAELRAAADGIWTADAAATAHEAIRINDRARPYFNMPPDHSLGLKLLRYAATRNAEFAPNQTTTKRQGFHYPPLELFQNDNNESVLTTLEVLEEQQFLFGRLVTRSYACASCLCHFLNFREVCPHCHSVDLTSHDLVHHFRCGFTAELDDFEAANGLVCPKCRRALGNIGVDYDKPSALHHCESCHYDFQEPDVGATCFACGHSAAPDNHVRRDIKSYTLTAIGREAATLGFESMFLNRVSEGIRLCTWSVFTHFLEVESERIERYKRSESTLMLIHLRGLDEIYMRLGPRSRDLFSEIADHLRALVRVSDIVTARSETVLALLLTETSQQQAQVVTDRLASRINEAITASFGVSIDLFSETLPVGPSIDADYLIEDFVSRNVS